MKRYDTIIVGAGICGLTAAIELASRRKRVLVLEAEDEVGGRAKSITLPNGVVFNTGANWFHGGDKNPFYQWAKAHFDLGPVNEDKVDSRRVAIRDGKIVTDQLRESLEKLEEAYVALSDKNISLAELAERTGTDDARDLASFWATLWMAGNSAEDINAKDFFEDPLGAGGWQLQNGLSSLMSQMVDRAKSLGVEIMTGQPVGTVQTHDKGVFIITKSGVKYSAGNAIVTVSIGVLQSGMIEFDGETRQILEAKTNGLSMGHFFKACLPMKESYFERGDIPENFPVSIIDRDDKYFIHARTAGKPTITVFSGGERAQAMERWELSAVKDFAYAALDRSRQFEGFRDFVAGDIVTTTWSANPYYGGVYVVSPPGHTKCDPFGCGRVFFAGEAMVARPQDSPGQMAGAWNSARKVISMLSANLR